MRKVQQISWLLLGILTISSATDDVTISDTEISSTLEELTDKENETVLSIEPVIGTRADERLLNYKGTDQPTPITNKTKSAQNKLFMSQQQIVIDESPPRKSYYPTAPKPVPKPESKPPPPIILVPVYPNTQYTNPNQYEYQQQQQQYQYQYQYPQQYYEQNGQQYQYEYPPPQQYDQKKQLYEYQQQQHEKEKQLYEYEYQKQQNEKKKQLYEYEYQKQQNEKKQQLYEYEYQQQQNEKKQPPIKIAYYNSYMDRYDIVDLKNRNKNNASSRVASSTTKQP